MEPKAITRTDHRTDPRVDPRLGRIMDRPMEERLVKAKQARTTIRRFRETQMGDNADCA